MKINVAFTGSRKYDIMDNENNDVMQNVADLLVGCQYIDNLYFGCAVGVNTEMLIRIGSTKPALTNFKKSLIACIPDTLDHLHPGALDAVNKYADEVIELKNEITHKDWFKSFHIRDKFMVNHCTKLFAFPNKFALENKKGGTWATMKYSFKNKHERVENMDWNEEKQTIVYPLNGGS